MIQPLPVVILLAATMLAGCATSPAPPTTPVPQTAQPVATVAAAALPATTPSAWIGRWHAPEGRFLQIMPSAQSGVYQLVLGDADGRQTRFAATASDDRLYFTRAGNALAIRAGTGTETGYPALAARPQCLIVVPGPEGYCRTPASADALPLAPGAYAPVTDNCWAPAPASLLYFNGRALTAPQTLACRTPVVDQTGVIFTLDVRCDSADPTQAPPRQWITVADAQRFAVEDEHGVTELYKYCPATELPPGMRLQAD